MISIGVVAVVVSRSADDASATDAPPTEPPPISVDERTREGIAEAFLDAWRKRAHHDAIRWSTGEARDAVEERAAREAALPPSETAVQGPWQALAKNRLRLEVKQREALADGVVRLRTEAAGEFFGGPYRRVVDFEVATTPDGYRVRAIRFGEILEAPDAIREEPP
jgi:hypothetical protein